MSNLLGPADTGILIAAPSPVSMVILDSSEKSDISVGLCPSIQRSVPVRTLFKGLISKGITSLMPSSLITLINRLAAFGVNDPCSITSSSLSTTTMSLSTPGSLAWKGKRDGSVSVRVIRIGSGLAGLSSTPPKSIYRFAFSIFAITASMVIISFSWNFVPSAGAISSIFGSPFVGSKGRKVMDEVLSLSFRSTAATVIVTGSVLIAVNLNIPGFDRISHTPLSTDALTSLIPYLSKDRIMTKVSSSIGIPAPSDGETIATSGGVLSR